MKTPVWIPSLVLVMAWAFACLAQNETDRAVPASPALPFPTAKAMPEAAATVASSLNLRLSHWTSEIVRLAQSGIEDTVMLAFIDNSGAFNLGADDIIYLNDLGVSSQVVSAMLQHDRDVISALTQAIAPSPPATQTAAVPAAADGDSSTRMSTPSPTAPAQSVAAMTSLTDGTNGKSVPESNPSSPGPQFSSAHKLEPVSPPVAGQLQPGPEKRRILYPVREPYPVELTAPIVFLDAPSF